GGFASLSRGIANVRTIRQPKNPMHARVDWSNFVTAGFALHDSFPFAIRDRVPGSFAQRQIKKTRRLRSFCNRHHLVTLLSSICETDAASHHPIALAKLGARGALYVIDLDVLDEPPTTFCESSPTQRIVGGMLGRAWSGLGQYSVPPSTAEAFEDLWRDMPQRIDHLTFGFTANSKNCPSEVTIDGDNGLLE